MGKTKAKLKARIRGLKAYVRGQDEYISDLRLQLAQTHRRESDYIAQIEAIKAVVNDTLPDDTLPNDNHEISLEMLETSDFRRMIKEGPPNWIPL